MELIKSYKERMNRNNVFESVKDAKEYDEKLKKYFDAVLCDAPCSGLGVVNDNPDIKLNRTEEDVYSLIREQREILNTVKNYVKVGGYLYYSTCSVLKIENDKTVEAFLENNKNFEVEEIESKLNGEKTEYGIQFLPDISGGLGFFVAKLKRKK